MSRESLAALTRGIHHAASSTYSMLAQQYIQMIAQFFEQREDENGHLKLCAKMVYVKINENTETPVPLISLVAPKGLALERMKVNMSVKIEEMESKQATIDEDLMDIDRLSFKITISPRPGKSERRASDITDIEMEFCAGDPPEGVMRLIDTYTNMLDPKTLRDKKSKEDHAAFIKQFPSTDLKYTGKKKMEKETPGSQEA